MSKLTLNWANGTPIASGTYVTAQLYVANLSGGDTITVQGSADNTTFVTMMGNNLATFASNTTISANGIYSYVSTGQIQWTHVGVASTPVVNILLKR